MKNWDERERNQDRQMTKDLMNVTKEEVEVVEREE